MTRKLGKTITTFFCRSVAASQRPPLPAGGDAGGWPCGSDALLPASLQVHFSITVVLTKCAHTFSAENTLMNSKMSTIIMQVLIRAWWYVHLVLLQGLNQNTPVYFYYFVCFLMFIGAGSDKKTVMLVLFWLRPKQGTYYFSITLINGCGDEILLIEYCNRVVIL